MITLAIALVALAALYLYGTRTFNYWEKKGVKHDKPVVLVGNNLQVYLMKKSMTQKAAEMYWKYPKEKIVGFYRSTHPELVIRDPEIVKRILLTDFQYFYPRGLNPHKTVIEPMMRNLFFADGDLWRMLRQRITPAFTSGKLKAMFPLIVERAEKLQTRALTAAAAGRPMDARDLMARYTTDFIGACGFGLDADSLNEEDSAFRKLGASIFKVGAKEVFVAMLKEMFPEWCKNLKYLSRVEQPIIDLVSVILKQRNYEPSGRNDFIDLLLECQKKGKMMVESVERMKPDGSPEIATLELTDELIAAQVFVFFAAGFETSSSATSFTLHQLAYHPEEQRRVQREIDAVLARHGGRLSYDAVKEMTYLECAFNEGMRMFPSLGFLVRTCARTYTIPEVDVTLDPDVSVFIPLQALHNDPQYFPEPHVFRPERFLPGQQDDATKFVYLPFGDGPRACIGNYLSLCNATHAPRALSDRKHFELTYICIRKLVMFYMYY